VRIGTCQLRIQRYYRRLPTNNRSREIGEPKIWATLSWRPSMIDCKFGGDPAICPREEAICAKVYRRTDRQTDGRTDGQTTDAVRLYKLMNELITKLYKKY